MKLEPIEKIHYNGYYINICQDDSPMSPDEWLDENFLVHYHRDCWIENKAVEKGEIADWYRGENESIEKKYWIWPVAAYIHGGVSLSIGSGSHFPDYNWDVSHVGAVLVKRRKGLKEE